MGTRRYQDLIAWQKAIELVVLIYKITAKFPESETYGLVSQMRRSAVSIPSNIAEGSKRGTKKDFLYFLRIAHGSTAELETQCMIVKKLMLASPENMQVTERMLDDVARLLYRMVEKFAARSYRPS